MDRDGRQDCRGKGEVEGIVIFDALKRIPLFAFEILMQ
jgi:hypothetical protein